MTLVFSNGKVSFTIPVGATVSLEISTIASGSQVVNDVSATATLDASYGMPNYSSTKTARATCDVISGATRTIGFWRTHLQYATHILDEHTLDSAATRNADGTVLDGPLGVTANGTFVNGAYITLGWKKLYSVQDVMGILWADVAKQTTGKKRTSLCQARIITSKQLVGAILNSGLDNAQDDGGLIAQAITALAGTNISAIKSVGSQLDAYNNSGDDVGLIDLDGTLQGPATPQAAKAYANKDSWQLLIEFTQGCGPLRGRGPHPCGSYDRDPDPLQKKSLSPGTWRGSGQVTVEIGAADSPPPLSRRAADSRRRSVPSCPRGTWSRAAQSPLDSPESR